MSGRRPRVGGLGRRAWRRLERRARADHEGAVLAAARHLRFASDGFVSEPQTDQGRKLGLFTLRAADRQLVLAGVSGAARERLQDSPPRRWRVADAGRYGPWWWVRLTVPEAGPTGPPVTAPVTILATHLRIDPVGRAGDDGRAPVPPSRLGVGA